MIYLYIYLIIINFTSALICLYDKFCASKNLFRVPEKHLLILCGLGGCVGMFIMMHIANHKTLKTKFVWGVPLIFLTQCILAIFIIKFILNY